jgi:hypothetical protein
MAAGTKTRPVPTYDHLAKKKPMEIHDWIPLDDGAIDSYNEAHRELQNAELVGEEKRLATARAAHEKAESQLRANSIEVVFRSIGRPRYEELQRAHPPTEAQIEEHKEQYGVPAEYNAETFAPALIAASCVQPEMDTDQVRRLIGAVCSKGPGHDDSNCKECKGKGGYGWNAGEYAHLFQLAIRANTTRRVANLAF